MKDDGLVLPLLFPTPPEGGREGGGGEAPSRFLFLLSIFGNVSIVVDRRGREEGGGGEESSFLAEEIAKKGSSGGSWLY